MIKVSISIQNFMTGKVSFSLLKGWFSQVNVGNTTRCLVSSLNNLWIPLSLIRSHQGKQNEVSKWYRPGTQKNYDIYRRNQRERDGERKKKQNQGITLVHTDVNSHYQAGTVSAAEVILQHFGKLIPVVGLIILWYLRYHLINIQLFFWKVVIPK